MYLYFLLWISFFSLTYVTYFWRVEGQFSLGQLAPCSVTGQFPLAKSPWKLSTDNYTLYNWPLESTVAPGQSPPRIIAFLEQLPPGINRYLRKYEILMKYEFLMSKICLWFSFTATVEEYKFLIGFLDTFTSFSKQSKSAKRFFPNLYVVTFVKAMEAHNLSGKLG